MKYSLSSDLIRSATIIAFVLIDVGSAKTPCSTGSAGVITSRFTKGLPDYHGQPSNSLSSSWNVGNGGFHPVALDLSMQQLPVLTMAVKVCILRGLQSCMVAKWFSCGDLRS
jgi:hypothetical protein